MLIDDVIDNLPFIVPRNHRIVAAFARMMAAEDCAQMRSRDDETATPRKKLSRSAGDQAIPALGETAADNTPGG